MTNLELDQTIAIARTSMLDLADALAHPEQGWIVLQNWPGITDALCELQEAWDKRMTAEGVRPMAMLEAAE